MILAKLAVHTASSPPLVREPLFEFAYAGFMLALVVSMFRFADHRGHRRPWAREPRGAVRGGAERRQRREDRPAGIVELIGVRSPCARVLDRALVAYPNDKLPDSNLERGAAHEHTLFEIRLHLGLPRRSRPLYDICARIETLLACHPVILGAPPFVHPTGPGDRWFDLEAMAWFDAPDWASFQVLCDQLLQACLDIVGNDDSAREPAPLLPSEATPPPS
jgi:hypothetical protein